tara:strand:+ start:78 stop:359 length:282 start_codon:yes stop_codon:yes gene_type:complete
MDTTNNPKGRKKGVPNKTTAETKEILKNFIDYALEDMVKLYDELGNRDKVNLITRVLPFVLPKSEGTEAQKSEELDNTINIIYHGPDGIKKTA